jgi:hypothetical protein
MKIINNCSATIFPKACHHAKNQFNKMLKEKFFDKKACWFMRESLPGKGFSVSTSHD